MKRRPWWKTIVVALAVFGTAAAVFWLPGLDLAPPREFTPWDGEALDMLVEMNKLLLSLCSLLIGGLGVVIFKQEIPSLWNHPLRLLLGLSLYCSCFSLYWGFVVYSRGLEMVEAQAFSSADPGLQSAQMAQFYSFLIALLLFSIVALRGQYGPPRPADNDDSVRQALSDTGE